MTDVLHHNRYAPRRATSSARWPLRRSALFVLAASGALWMLILAPAAAL